MKAMVGRHRRFAACGPRGWRERLLLALLTPAGWLYGCIGLCRSALYRAGWLPSYRAAVPVISIGNLTAGGTGKTPAVDYLLEYFLSRGTRVAVVSRGYGGQGVSGEVGVVCAGGGPLLPPEICGDEPFLLARRNPAALVLIAPQRRKGVQLAVEGMGAEVVLLDDGFQHLAVARDLDLVLLDGRRPFGNGHLLPAGLLREFPGALRRGDLFVLTRCMDQDTMAPRLPGPVLHSRHTLGEEAVTLAGERVALAELVGRKGVAFAGIADPESFFTDLRGAGLHLTATLPLGDHAVYDAEIIEDLQQAAGQADYLITTEKDGVKLAGKDFPVPCFQVPMRLAFREEGELEKILLRTLNSGGMRGHFQRTA